MTIPLQNDRVQPPSDYQLLLPKGWFRVHLEPERRAQSVDALVNRQFSGVDNAPQARQLLRQELYDRATRAFGKGGIELYISLQQAGALTIPASLLVTLISRQDEQRKLPSLRDLADALDSGGDDQREVSIVELAAGKAVRVRIDPLAQTGTGDVQVLGSSSEDGYALPSVTVDYQLCIPRSDRHLLLTFSSPLVQIADSMVELFDAVAGSLSWKDGA